MLDPRHPDAPTEESPTIVRDLDEGGFVRVNRAFARQTGYDSETLAGWSLRESICEQDREKLDDALRGTRECFRAGHRTVDGEPLEIVWQIGHEGAEPPMAYGTIETCEDRCSKGFGTTVPPERMSEILTAMIRIIEDERPGMRCSVLLVDGKGRKVSVGAGPSLPATYNDAIEGLAIGPTVGSCGTAAYWNQRVIVEDIERDPLWRNLKEHAKQAGVAACWSQPITAGNGRVLGATALYNTEPRVPTERDLAGLATAGRMFGLAIERGEAEYALRENERRRRELEDQLHQAAKMEALGVLAGGLAHDFNNVLATVLGNAELAQEIVPADSAAQENLTDIVSATRSATELCNQMLAYAGRGALSTQRLDCNKLIDEFGNLLRVTLSKKATLEFVHYEGKLFIEADRTQIGQVLMNLISNAAESLGNESGRIVVRTDRRYWSVDELVRFRPGSELAAGDYVQISVTDTGCGMDAETQEKLYDPFYTTKFAGRGLGLAAVRGIVMRHGGGVTFESEPGVGTTFTVVLPARSPVDDTSVGIPSPSVSHGPKRVLVVDDEAQVRRTLVKILRKEGFDVVEASNGREAIEVFGRLADAIHCVLLDLSMPELDGEETFRELKKIRGDVRVVLNSGYAENETLDRFSDAGFAGVLQKPTPTDVLVRKITQAAR